MIVRMANAASGMLPSCPSRSLLSLRCSALLLLLLVLALALVLLQVLALQQPLVAAAARSRGCCWCWLGTTAAHAAAAAAWLAPGAGGPSFEGWLLGALSAPLWSATSRACDARQACSQAP
jgi:hypothetical protein